MPQSRWQTTAALGAVMTAGVAFGGIALASTHPDPRPALPARPPASSHPPQLHESKLLKNGYWGVPRPAPQPGVGLGNRDHPRPFVRPQV